MNKKRLRRQILVTAAGVAVLFGIAVFSYQDVRRSIVLNEQESLRIK